jgi:hypothetical protein
MAALLREESAWTEVRALSAQELLHEIRAEDCERILERLHNRTNAEIKRDLELGWAAANGSWIYRTGVPTAIADRAAIAAAVPGRAGRQQERSIGRGESAVQAETDALGPRPDRFKVRCCCAQAPSRPRLV